MAILSRGEKHIVAVRSTRVGRNARVSSVTSARDKRYASFFSGELKIILGFYQQQLTYRLANDLGLNCKTVRRVVQRLRETTYHVSELEASRLKEDDKSH